MQTGTFEPSKLSNDELASAYQDLRTRCLELARELTVEECSAMTPCCPEWSSKDVIAHLAGITTDILTGNLEGAATPEWADAHVADRKDKDMAEVCVEWEANGPEIDNILRELGDKIDQKFYIDALTHEWDFRQANNLAAKPDIRFISHSWETLTDHVEIPNSDHPPAEVDPFTLFRAVLGRRSRDQIAELGLDADRIVFFEPSVTDIFDPIASL